MLGQMSIFDLIEPTESKFNPLEALALRGTGFVDGMKRVHKYFSENQTLKERALFLKKEYGIGGFGSPVKKPRYVYEMDTFGHTKRDVVFAYFDENMNDIKSSCSWEELARVIGAMIEKGTYIDKE